jgi:hypothetical protein
MIYTVNLPDELASLPAQPVISRACARWPPTDG